MIPSGSHPYHVFTATRHRKVKIIGHGQASNVSSSKNAHADVSIVPCFLSFFLGYVFGAIYISFDEGIKVVSTKCMRHSKKLVLEFEEWECGRGVCVKEELNVMPCASMQVSLVAFKSKPE